jgi:ABC-type polysaccharide/polyol phosphate export permease
MKERLHQLIQYRDLLFILTWKEIRVRYKQSVMGVFWAILMPMLIVLSGILVKQAYATLSGVSLQWNDIASVSVKALPWAFFSGSLRFATASLVGNSNLVTKIYFPREVLPLAFVLAHLFDFSVAALALTAFLVVADVGVSVHLCWLPLILFLFVLFTAASCMFLACANLFLRDVKYLVELFLTFGIFLVPIFYESRMLGDWAFLIQLNPIASFLEMISATVVGHQPPDPRWLSYAAVWSVAGFFTAWKLFDWAEPAFAERI